MPTRGLLEIRKLLLAQAGWRFPQCEEGRRWQDLKLAHSVKSYSAAEFIGATVTHALNSGAAVDASPCKSLSAEGAPRSASVAKSLAVERPGGSPSTVTGGDDGLVRLSAAFYQSVCEDAAIEHCWASPVPLTQRAEQKELVGRLDDLLRIWSSPVIAAAPPGSAEVRVCVNVCGEREGAFE